MVEIEVKKIDDWEFGVEIEDGDGGTKTTHQVTLARDFAERLGLKPEEAVRKSFEFLLARESKESILSSFSIPDTILHYFPNFEDEVSES